MIRVEPAKRKIAHLEPAKNEPPKRKIARFESAKKKIATPQGIKTLETRPTTLINIFSFLLKKEQEDIQPTCKKWKILISYLPIRDGYGDFLLVHKSGEVDKTVFAKAFPHMNHYLPQVHQKPHKNRLQEASQLVKTIDPHLELIFIPRTLYELYYIYSAFEEETNLRSKKHMGCIRDTNKEIPLCWHSYHFQGYTNKHNLDANVIALAFRLNQIIVKKLDPHVGGGLTKRQCIQAGKDLLTRFQAMDQVYTAFMQQQGATLVSDCISDDTVVEKIHMGIMLSPLNIEKMISLECSSRAINALILSRGSRYIKEPLYQEGVPYSCSYGTSLFAGYIHDTDASAVGRISYEENTIHSYAIYVSLKEEGWQNVFFVPPVTTICGINGADEDFHSRRKCLKPKEKEEGEISGYLEKEEDEEEEETQPILDHLFTPLSETELAEKIEAYKKTEVVLTEPQGKKRGKLSNCLMS